MCQAYILSENYIKCIQACEYSPKYRIASSTAQSMDKYIIINLDNANNNSKASFQMSGQPQNKEYEPHNIKIYVPSIHGFGKTNSGTIKKEGEMFIEHKIKGETESSFYVSIPLNVGTDYNVNLNNILTQIISHNSDGSAGALRVNSYLNINELIPDQPYYVYNANLPIASLEENYICNSVNPKNILVFKKGISINSSILAGLQELLTDPGVNRIEPPQNTIYYNSEGPNLETKEEGGDIYIDCKPTGDSGEKVVRLESKNLDEISNNIINIFSNMKFFYFVMAVLLGVFFYWIVYRYIPNKIIPKLKFFQQNFQDSEN